MLSMADFPHVSDHRLRAVLAHWLEIRRGRLLPARTDIDPAMIRAALPYVWLCDYVPEKNGFRYRLAGEEVNAFAGMSLVGRDLEEVLPADARAEVLERYRGMLRQPTVVYMAGKLYFSDGRALDGERVVLPLGADGRHMDTLWGALVCDWKVGRTAALRGEALVRTVTPLNESTD